MTVVPIACHWHFPLGQVRLLPMRPAMSGMARAAGLQACHEQLIFGIWKLKNLQKT
jgi:hypothetical protein